MIKELLSIVAIISSFAFAIKKIGILSYKYSFGNSHFDDEEYIKETVSSTSVMIYAIYFIISAIGLIFYYTPDYSEVFIIFLSFAIFLLSYSGFKDWSTSIHHPYVFLNYKFKTLFVKYILVNLLFYLSLIVAFPKFLIKIEQLFGLNSMLKYYNANINNAFYNFENIDLKVLFNLIMLLFSLTGIFLFQGTMRVLSLYKNSTNTLSTLFLSEPIYGETNITGRIKTSNSTHTILEIWDKENASLESIIINKKIIKAIKSVISSNRISQGKYKNKGLEKFVISEKINIIEKKAFLGNSLSEIVIPNSILTIGDYAFIQNKITSVVIPNSVQHIGKMIFDPTVKIICEKNSLAHKYAKLVNYKFEILNSKS